MKIKLYTIQKELLPFLILLGAILAQPTYGQVTIGSGLESAPGALLQIKENAGTTNNSTRGLSLPQVNLTSKTNLYPMFETSQGSGIANSSYDTPTLKDREDALHIGLIVFHTDQCTLSGLGLYFWNGKEWLKIGDDSNLFESMVKILGTNQDQIATNGVAWHKDHEGNIFFSMNYDVTTPTANNNRWMITNLGTKTYAPRTGGEVWTAPVLTNTYATNSSPYTAAYWGYPNPVGTTTANLATAYDARPALGLLYNWAAATGNQNQTSANQSDTLLTGVQGICPQGWHLPTDKEWEQLIAKIKANASQYSTTSILGISDRFVFVNGCESASSGGTNKGQSHPILDGGFSILLAGNVSSNKTAGFGKTISYWTSNSASANSAYSKLLSPASTMNNSWTNSTSSKSLMYSVRCKKDE